jgi:hypothetical protein
MTAAAKETSHEVLEKSRMLPETGAGAAGSDGIAVACEHATKAMAAARAQLSLDPPARA